MFARYGASFIRVLSKCRKMGNTKTVGSINSTVEKIKSAPPPKNKGLELYRRQASVTCCDTILQTECMRRRGSF